MSRRDEPAAAPASASGAAGAERSGWGLAAAAFALGFALSGFFDGILLHQILQWHHLLSAIEGDLRFQVVADGWFHVAMYAVAAVGLWRLWRARGALGAPGAGRALAAWGLIGFGAWHLVDAVGSHWLLGIHRIRMDAASPLAWDLAWAAAFGAAPLALGLWLRGRGGGSRPPATDGGAAGPGHPRRGRLGRGAASGPRLRHRGLRSPRAADRGLRRRGRRRRGGAVGRRGGRGVRGRGPASARGGRALPPGALFVGGAGLSAGCLASARKG